MGVEKFRRPVYDGSLVAASTGTNIAPGVASIAASTTNKTFTLSGPVPGVTTRVFVDTSSTGVITVRTNSSAHTLFGSTNDSAAVSTGAGVVALDFVPLSTAKTALSASSPTAGASTGTVLTTLATSTR